MGYQMIPADQSLRRRALGLILAAGVLGALALTALSAHLGQVTSVATMRAWLWGVAGLASGGGLAFGGYLAWMARQVLRTGQFPVPGQRVVRDTVVRQGRAARRIALLAVAGAALLWATSLTLPVLLWRLLRSLGE